jgi:hypothetical protein
MTNDKRDGIAAKIRALLAKTAESGCSENEALAAVEMAQKLMDKYAIDLSETELRAEKLVQHSAPPQGKHADMVRDLLMTAVEKYTHTKSWRSGYRKFDLVFAGLESDVQFAHYLINSLVGYVMRGADDARQKGFDRRSFALGAATRIYKRLTEMNYERRVDAATHKSTGMELMIVTKRELVDNWMSERGIKLSKSYSGIRGASDASARAAGDAYGSRANLGRPLGGSVRGYLK